MVIFYGCCKGEGIKLINRVREKSRYDQYFLVLTVQQVETGLGLVVKCRIPCPYRHETERPDNKHMMKQVITFCNPEDLDDISQGMYVLCV